MPAKRRGEWLGGGNGQPRRDGDCGKRDSRNVEGWRGHVPGGTIGADDMRPPIQMPGNGDRLAHSLRGRSRSRLPSIPSGGRQAGVEKAATFQHGRRDIRVVPMCMHCRTIPVARLTWGNLAAIRGHVSEFVFWTRPAREDDELGNVPGSSRGVVGGVPYLARTSA
jgi:hypothetical protein